MQNHTRYLCSLLLVLLLTACQSLPQGFSPQQVRVLQQEGFEPLGEDWVLNLSVLILFGFDEASLNQQSQQEVQRLGRTLLDIGIDKIRISATFSAASRCCWTRDRSGRYAALCHSGTGHG